MTLEDFPKTDSLNLGIKSEKYIGYFLDYFKYFNKFRNLGLLKIS
jgi:hypothetical protein